jgi:hypothetical protein
LEDTIFFHEDVETFIIKEMDMPIVISEDRTHTVIHLFMIEIVVTGWEGLLLYHVVVDRGEYFLFLACFIFYHHFFIDCKMRSWVNERGVVIGVGFSFDHINSFGNSIDLGRKAIIRSSNSSENSAERVSGFRIWFRRRDSGKGGFGCGKEWEVRIGGRWKANFFWNTRRDQ